MNSADDLAARKAQLVAQCDLDRMRLTHAMLIARQAASPFAGGGTVRTMAGRALGIALPLFQVARRHGIVRVVALGVAVFRAVRNLLHRH